MSLNKPLTGDTWLGLDQKPLPVNEVLSWVGRPDCGAVVLFNGNARDHTVERQNVIDLTYEAYEEQVIPRLIEIANKAREQWPTLGRLALLHRTGVVEIGHTAVVVAVSSPHRDEAFAAGRWCIDTLKEVVPIWKRETWDGGESWGTDAQHILEVSDLDISAANEKIGDEL